MFAKESTMENTLTAWDCAWIGYQFFLSRRKGRLVATARHYIKLAREKGWRGSIRSEAAARVATANTWGYKRALIACTTK